MDKLACFLLLLVGIVPGICGCTYQVYSAIEFNVNCAGYLKRAADSSSPEIASKELDIAIKYMEDNHLTSGSSHILYYTPGTDIGFWYNNIKSANDDLKSIKPDASNLEKSNMLIKLKEVLLDGDKLTQPDGISAYPYQTMVAFSAIIFVICACIVVFMLLLFAATGPEL